MKCKLGTLAAVKGGKRLPKGINLISTTNSHPYIRVRDLNDQRTLELNSNYEFVDDETQKQIARYIVQKGDIILSIVGTIGLVAMVGESLDNANLTENCVKIVATEKIDSKFLYYYLKSSKGQAEITRGIVGAVQAKLPIKNIQDIDVWLPRKDIQTKIASLLSCLDDKIELNNKINKNLERQAFSLFHMLITEFGEQECQVSDIAFLNPKRPLSKNQVARYIDMSQLSTTGAFPSGWEKKPFTGGMRFSNGDTLLARITPCLENGKTAYINFLNDEEVAFGSTEYIVLAPKSGVPSEFLYCLARYPEFVDYAVKNMNGSSGRQRVSADTIGRFVLRRPSQRAMNDFESVTSCLFMEMKNHFFENLKISELRDALLPKLMSGEIDVSTLRV